MKLNFKSDKLGLAGALELDFKEVIELTKFTMENKEELRQLNLDFIEHLDEVMVKLVEKFGKFQKLDRQIQEMIKAGVKETVVPVVEKVVKVEEPKEEVIAKKEITEEKKPEVDPKDLAIILNGLMRKL